MDISGQTVIVVGGGSGIGLGIARASLAAGADVVIAGRSADKLERARTALAGASRTIMADVTSEDDVRRLYDTIGSFDHLVSTASDRAYQPVRDFRLTDAAWTLESKLVSALALVKHGVDRIRPHGSFTFTSGIAAERPAVRGAMVAAVNRGLDGLVRALAIEVAPIRVNAVSPGWVDTPAWDTIGVDKDEAFGQMAKRLPVGRIGTPEDIAEGVLFLMKCGFATGITLPIDGGHRLV